MPGFSGMVDHFGLAGTDLKLHASTDTPHAKNVETATDERDNIVAQGVSIGGPGVPVECVYRLVSGTLDLSTLSLGALVVVATDDCIVESIGVSTSNGEWPEITVSGIQWTGDTDCVSQFPLPAITVTGCKLAQQLGFTLNVSDDFRLTGSSVEASGEIAHVLATAAAVGAVALSGATLEIGGEFLCLVAVPTVTYTADTVVAVQAPTTEDGITEHGSGSFSGTGYIEAES